MFKDLKHADKEHKNKYGFVEIRNPEYMQACSDGGDDEVYYDERLYLMRKPTPAERREIVINLIMQNSGRRFKIGRLAELLAVSKRTMQLLLKSLREDGLIEAVNVYGRNGEQLSSRYRYIGEPCAFYGSGLTLERLYDSENAAGFRDWEWKDFRFRHDGRWYDITAQMFAKFDTNEARRKFLKEKGIVGVVSKGIRYFVLRYSYWRGEEYKLYSYDADNDRPFLRVSKDGTHKFELGTEIKYDLLNIGRHKFLLFYAGNADNPKVRIYDVMKGKKLTTFTWMTGNAIISEERIDDKYAEVLKMFGDFTTR